MLCVRGAQSVLSDDVTLPLERDRWRHFEKNATRKVYNFHRRVELGDEVGEENARETIKCRGKVNAEYTS